MLRIIKHLCALLVVSFLIPEVRAQEIHFETGAPRMVAVGEAFRIEFSLNAKPEDFTAPSFEGFDVLAGPTTSQGQSVSIVNGKVSQSVSFSYTYVLQARSAGTFTIPAARVKAKGKEYTTQPVPIEVVAAEAMQQQAPSSGSRGGQERIQPQSSSAHVAEDDILVRVSVNRNKVYKGQPVKATFKLYTRVPLGGIEKAIYPAFNGFWAQDLNVDGYDWQRETYNGKVYDSRIIKETLLFPQQSGTLYIEQFSLTVVAQIMTQVAPRGSLFDDFFGGGPQIQEVRRNLTASPIRITVDEFPAGAPATFNGAVGQFQISSALADSTLAANSSGTYQLKISGNGNLPLIQAPKLTLPSSFEQYNMKTTESLNSTTMGIAGYRQFEYPFIPRGEGFYTIEPVQFSYFDPDKKQYVTLSTPTYSVNILADSTSSGTGERGLVSGISKEELKILDEDIRFIRIGNPDLKKRGTHWFGSLTYWLLLVILAGAGVGSYFYLKKQLRDRKNTTLVRNKKANKVALQRLKAAQNHMNTDNERLFYEEMLKALWGYMSDKLNIPVANLTKDNIREELLRRGLAAEQSERFIQLISDCEYAQYSPSSSGHMNEIYNAAVKMLSKFESVIKK